MEYRKYNEYQTPIEELEELSREAREELLSALDDIEFVKRLVSPDMKTVAEMPKDDTGKVIVDITTPHRLENMDYFRQTAIHFQEHGVYTSLTPSSHPLSQYKKFWEQEIDRIRNGMAREDGEWIPGGLYWYWNYCPMERTKRRKKSSKRSDRVVDFPDVFLGDYLFFHYLEQAMETGSHGELLKTRGIGWSYKQASFGTRKALFFKNSSTFYAAYEKEFLVKDGVLNKAWAYLDFLAQHTPFPRMRLRDNIMEKKMGYKDPRDNAEKGMLSNIMGVSAKDDPDKLRGKRGDIYFEEHGVFPQIKKAWQVSLDSVEDGENVFGLMVAGGCLTKNNLVWTGDGELLSIEDLYYRQEKTILGYKEDGVSVEPVNWFKEPQVKPCYRISTSGNNFIECSEDHPILASSAKDKVYLRTTGYNKKIYFKEAAKLKIGDQLAIIDEVPVFGSEDIEDARLLGLLIGDGHYKNGIELSCGDEEIFEYVSNNYKTKVTYEALKKSEETYRKLYISNFRDVLKRNKMYGEISNRKRLPNDIHKYSKKSLAELLGGYFDADGHITYTHKKTGLKIVLTSVNEELLNQVKFQLSKFGISCIITTEYIKNSFDSEKNTTVYKLYINNITSLKRFKDNIKLLCKHKQALLDTVDTYKNIDRLRPAKCRFFNTTSTEEYFDDHRDCRGLRFESITKIEYIGEQETYNLNAGTTSTYIGNQYVTHNTGGTVGSDFEGAEDMHYNPESYHIYGIPNVFDRFAVGKTNTGFFWGAYLNRANCYDNNGMPDVVKALKEIMVDRDIVKKSSTDPVHVTQRKAERPITPQEAVMRVEGNFFPVADLKDYLERCRIEGSGFTNRNYVGNLIFDKEIVKWEESLDLIPVRNYPLKDNKVEGAIEIYTHPKKMGNKPVPNRYIAGIDPIDDDASTTSSLASIFIFDLFSDEIVAEYTGRPKFAKDFYEICRRLLMYYDARANYESDKKGIFAHFELYKCLYLLVDTPQILRDMEYVKTPGYGNKSKGTNSGKTINAWGRRLQRDWLLTPAINKNIDNDGNIIESTLNMHKIRSLAYLEELINWNADGNFDRVSSMGMCMILRADKMKYLESYKNIDTTNGSELAQDPYFRANYDDKWREIIDFSHSEGRP